MKVLVTGGAGFIGSHVVAALQEAGHQPVVVDSLVHGRRDNLRAGIPLHVLDLNADALVDWIRAERPCIIMHLAAQVSVDLSIREPQYDAQVNLLGSLNLLEACRTAGVSKIIYASSAAVYGSPRYIPIDEHHPISPLSPYGVSKHTVEHYLEIYRQTYGLDYTVLRLANVYGPGQETSGESGVVARFADRIAREVAIEVHGDGEQVRDFVYVGDVAVACLASIERGGGKIINIGTGSGCSINQLLKTMAEEHGVMPTIQYALPRPGDIRASCLQIDRAQTLLGWAPQVALAEGLGLTISSYRR